MDEAQQGLPAAEETTLHAPSRASLAWSALLDAARREKGLAALVVMALIGLGDAIYLTTVHYAGVAPICSTTGVVNCAQVTSSQWSVVPGTELPITVPGMLWFVVSGGLALAALWAIARGLPESPRVRHLQLGWSVLGFVTVMYLIYVEIVKLHKLCEWCTVVHLLTILSLLVVVSRMQKPLYATIAPPAPHGAPRASGTTTATRASASAQPTTRATSARPSSASATTHASGAKSTTTARRPTQKSRGRR